MTRSLNGALNTVFSVVFSSPDAHGFNVPGVIMTEFAFSFFGFFVFAPLMVAAVRGRRAKWMKAI